MLDFNTSIIAAPIASIGIYYQLNTYKKKKKYEELLKNAHFYLNGTWMSFDNHYYRPEDIDIDPRAKPEDIDDLTALLVHEKCKTTSLSIAINMFYKKYIIPLANNYRILQNHLLSFEEFHRP